MPDIRDIVGQTSALEKIPSLDQRSNEVRAGKQAIGQLAENAVKQETVAATKDTKDKTIKKEQEEHEKRESRQKGKRRAKVKEAKEDTKKDDVVKEITGADIVEVDEGKIIDVKI